MNVIVLAIFTFSHAAFAQEVTIGIAAAIMLIGTRLCWNAPHYRMSMEERAKDGKLTEMQARRKIQLMDWGGPASIIIGAVLLALALLN